MLHRYVSSLEHQPLYPYYYFLETFSKSLFEYKPFLPYAFEPYFFYADSVIFYTDSRPTNQLLIGQYQARYMDQ